MNDERLKYIIKEALTKTDENKIGVMIRKEIKDAFGSNLEKKVKDIVSKELKGSKFEKEVIKISKDVLEQLYRELWLRRMFWKNVLSDGKYKKDYDKVKDIIMSCNNTTQLKVADKVLNKLIQKHKENIPPKQINILKQLIKLMNIKCTKGKSEDMNEISEIGKEFRDTLNKSNTPELKKVAATIEEEINIGTQIEQNHLPYEEIN